MLNNFQLVAIVKQGARFQLQRIPMHQALQHTLATTWRAQLDDFLDDVLEIAFNAGYQPEEHERFVLHDFQLPGWLASENSHTVDSLDSIAQNEEFIASIKGIAGFARDENGNELVLFQNFSRSHVIRPGGFLLLRNDTYETTERPGLTLNAKLSAIYLSTERKLLFGNFRTVNTFLPLEEFYEEATQQQILEVLAHDKLAPVNARAIAADSNQWFRKRFAMLRDSGVLERYSVADIQARSQGYDVEINVHDGRIIFPEDRPSAKKLLQFLNEELFRGAITETLYETNSKRESD